MCVHARPATEQEKLSHATEEIRWVVSHNSIDPPTKSMETNAESISRHLPYRQYITKARWNVHYNIYITRSFAHLQTRTGWTDIQKFIKPQKTTHFYAQKSRYFASYRLSFLFFSFFHTFFAVRTSFFSCMRPCNLRACVHAFSFSIVTDGCPRSSLLSASCLVFAY